LPLRQIEVQREPSTRRRFVPRTPILQREVNHQSTGENCDGRIGAGLGDAGIISASIPARLPSSIESCKRGQHAWTYLRSQRARRSTGDGERYAIHHAKAQAQGKRGEECGGATAEMKVSRVQLYGQSRDPTRYCAEGLGSV